jgi:3-oxoisoapionate decarboxylase
MFDWNPSQRCTAESPSMTIQNHFRMERRLVLQGLAALGLSSGMAFPSRASPLQERRTGVGLCQYCSSFERRQKREQDKTIDLFAPENYHAYARSMGAGGYQVELGVLEPARAKELRRRTEESGMYVEGMIKAPKTNADLDRFEAEMRTAATVGAVVVRSTIFTGRRYEEYRSLAQYQQDDMQSRRSLELAAPIAEKYKVGFAPENHKDHLMEERVEALKKISSQYVGVCLDTGNNISLLEDPVETVTALAPWALTVHLKDQALQATSKGFLLGDIPLGQGAIDLKSIVGIIRSVRPSIHFTLELLTRDPLLVPCLEDDYWATFPEVKGMQLARILRMVRDRSATAMHYPSKLSLDEQVALERKNIATSLEYARDELGLG